MPRKGESREKRIERLMEPFRKLLEEIERRAEARGRAMGRTGPAGRHRDGGESADTGRRAAAAVCGIRWDACADAGGEYREAKTGIVLRHKGRGKRFGFATPTMWRRFRGWRGWGNACMRWRLGGGWNVLERGSPWG